MAQQGFHFARKQQRAPVAPPVERLDPHRIACERQGAFHDIVHSEGEDALQTLGQPAEAPLLVAVHQNLGIAAGLEMMALRLEFGAEQAVVVDLAVEGCPDRPVLVAHRLLASMHVDDGETPVAEPAEIVGRAPLAFSVRPPTADRGQHLPRHIGRYRRGVLRTQSQITGDPAHLASVLFRCEDPGNSPAPDHSFTTHRNFPDAVQGISSLSTTSMFTPGSTRL